MQQRRPNILFVLADDLGQGDVSSFNPGAAWTTPHLDRLAAGGMRFTDSHATSSLCTPSRYAALTGRYNWRSRLKRSVLPGDSESLIEKDRLTLPGFLGTQGYRTAVVGKWHLGLDWQLTPEGNALQQDAAANGEPPLPEQRMGRGGNFDPDYMHRSEGLDIDYAKPVTFGPREVGFDYSFITAASLDQPPYVYLEDGQAQQVPTHIGGDYSPLNRVTAEHQQSIQKGPMAEGYDIHRVAPDFQAKALEVLDGFLAGEDPWFMYVPSHLVHGPIIPNEPWQGRSGQGPYGDFVLQFDEYVGQLVERIDAAGAGEDTIIIVTSDNGASGVADLPRLAAQGHDSSNGWRGIKSEIWEGGHREPTIVRWPGTIQAGSVSAETVSHSDLFATVADVLGAAVPETAAEDSISNLPLWTGSQEPVRTDLVSHSGGGGFAIRQGDWKLEFVTTGDGMAQRFAESQGATPTEYRAAQLYHLGQDPREQHNRLDEEPEVVRELTELLSSHIRRGRSTPGAERPNHANAPSRSWRQIAWMTDAETVVEQCL
ncbi:sulfatase family protein [Microbacterium sp. A93]|uniref:sulfatase family protein n=1 Tax=Microbacterium sp. A93 TaxID=3450716 RepID=UPI003F41D901